MDDLKEKKRAGIRKLRAKTNECPRCLSKSTDYCTPSSKGMIRCKNCGYVAEIARWKEENRARKAGFITKDLLGDFK